MEQFFDIIEQFDIYLIAYIFPFPFFINIFLLFFLMVIFYVSALNSSSIYNVILRLFCLSLKYSMVEKFSNNYFSIFLYPIFIGLGTYVAWLNITAIIPYSFSLTTLIGLPAFLTFTFFIASIIISLNLNKSKWFKSFLPNGVPVAIVPIIVPIELLSFFSRLVSLGLRLFINILAGHILLKVFYIMSYLVVNIFISFFQASLIIYFITLAFILIEWLACILQAVVITSLVAIYINNAIHFLH